MEDGEGDKRVMGNGKENQKSQSASTCFCCSRWNLQDFCGGLLVRAHAGQSRSWICMLDSKERLGCVVRRGIGLAAMLLRCRAMLNRALWRINAKSRGWTV